MGIELKGVSKRVGAETHIVATDLAFEKGGFNVLLGTTLSGKTTLLRLMAGLERPTEGEVWFAERNVTGVPVQQRSVAMVYQQFINYANFTVFENIASPLRVAGVAADQIRQRVGEISELLKLTTLLNRHPGELSGGQQQRTALARALVKNAELVLLDEPLANLDFKLREELRDELPRLFQDTGATVVYATTEPLEAMLLGGHTACLFQGQVTQYGPTAAVYRAPNSLLSAQVFSDPPMNTAPIQKQDQRFVLTDQVNWAVPERLQGIRDGSYQLGIRPYHLTWEAAHRQVVEVQGKVQISEISGSQSITHIDVDGHNWVSESAGVRPYEVGDEVTIFIDVSRCFYFTPDGDVVNG